MYIRISEKITLEPLSISDAEGLYPLIDSDRLNLGKYLSWVDSVIDIETTREYLQSRIHSGLNGASWYKIMFLGSAVGVFGVKTICEDQVTAEGWYWLHSNYYGNGIITQTISGIAQQLKSQSTIRNIEIRCLSENQASIAVALRVGGVHTGTIPDYNTIDSSPQDLNIYTVQLQT